MMGAALGTVEAQVERQVEPQNEQQVEERGAAGVVDVPVVEFVHPMPGFPDSRRFALVRLDEGGELCSLTSLDEPDVRFLVVPPGRFFPDYAPEVDDEVAASLRLDGAEDALLLVVLTAGESLASTTANLAAPVVLNPGARLGGQVVLDQPGLPVAAPLLG